MKSVSSILGSIRPALTGLAACLALSTALAQTAQPAATAASEPYTPRLGQGGKDVIWLPSHDQVVAVMLKMAKVTPRDYVVDLGSGDGKIPIAAARDFKARSLGLEYNANMVELSIRLAEKAGVQDKATFRKADIFESDFSTATVVTMYLLPELNLRLRPTLFKMKPGTRIVSNSFDMGTWVPDETATMGGSRAMLWIIPAHAAGTWTFQPKRNRSDLPHNLNLRQNFQKLEGEALYDQLHYTLQNLRIRGAELQFETRDPKGQTVQFKGRVDGDRLTGTFTQPGKKGGQRVEAKRTEAPAPFQEARGTDKEQNEAVRALGKE